MTAPRQVLPGTTYLVTRRCTQRQLLLRPSPLVNAIFLFVLATAARRYGVRVHAFCVLSNHFHLVVTDTRAQLPAFQQFLGGLVARALNALLGRWESFWAPASYSAVALATPQDIVDKAAYVLANPVAAGLVRHGREWPGLWSSPDDVGGCLQAPRPDHFFSKKGSMRALEVLELAVPPGFASAAEFRDALRRALAALEQRAHGLRPAFMGARKVLAQRPTSRLPPGEPRRGLRPRVAARDPWKRIELLTRLEGFLAAHAEALHAWREGRRDVIFPAGTYHMRVVHLAACAAA
jgi:REP element-mobilizing transposase RayT